MDAVTRVVSNARVMMSNIAGEGGRKGKRGRETVRKRIKNTVNKIITKINKKRSV